MTDTTDGVEVNTLTVALLRVLEHTANELLPKQAWRITVRQIGAFPAEAAHFGRDGCVIELSSSHDPDGTASIVVWAYSAADGTSYEGEWLDVSLTDGTRHELVFGALEERDPNLLQEIADLTRRVINGSVDPESGQAFRPYPAEPSPS